MKSISSLYHILCNPRWSERPLQLDKLVRRNSQDRLVLVEFPIHAAWWAVSCFFDGAARSLLTWLLWGYEGKHFSMHVDCLLQSASIHNRHRPDRVKRKASNLDSSFLRSSCCITIYASEWAQLFSAFLGTIIALRHVGVVLEEVYGTSKIWRSTFYDQNGKDGDTSPWPEPQHFYGWRTFPIFVSKNLWFRLVQDRQIHLLNPVWSCLQN